MSKTFPPNGLQTLILDRKRDRTYDQLAKDCGGTPSRGNLQRLATGPITDMPTTIVMRGLAKGLRVRIADVVRAAAISVGLPMEATSPNDLVIAGAGLLPSESQQAIVDTAANMMWWMEQVADQGDDLGETPDNVHQLRAPSWEKAAADAGETGIDPDLPEDE